MNSASGYINLHLHSHYSLLEAVPKIADLIEAAQADGHEALALTDLGNMYGSIEFYKDCMKAGIKPIIGVDFFVAPRTRNDKEHKTDEHNFRVVLLAQNQVGYHNLIRLVSASYLEGFFIDRPRIDRELMEKYSEGVIAILSAIDGECARNLSGANTERATEALAWYKKTFPERTYVEISHHPEIDGHNKNMKALATLAESLSVPLVAAQECFYIKKADAVARELVDNIRMGSVLNRDLSESLPDFTFLTRTEAEKNFKAFPGAIENSQKIADSCNLELSLGKAIFPSYPIPEGSTDNQLLREFAERGLAERGMEATQTVRERIDYELNIIRNKDYASYFLIVADLLKYARESVIYTNTRGSAAGSLVSYLCGITTVDPLALQLPFERFLNPERPSAPDIDMDIADNRRDDLIEYARKKYGTDHVVQIGTFGTMMARAAVRDVSRALGHSYGKGDAIAKMIPFGKQGFPVTIDSAMDEVPELKTAYRSDPDAREILDLAKRIEGNARHVGVHAAGVVIAPGAVMEYAPVQLDPKGGKTITQYDMYSIADEYGGVGLLKFDFLGLTNLSVLADAVARVEKRLHETVNLYRIPLDDTKVYEMLTLGRTLGVFQMASSGMTNYLKELEPTRVEDLNAMVALYRPGPMAFIPEYILRKKNPSRVKYLDPRLEAILKPTYGVLIYQDDVMLIAVQLAGYSWGDADKFRKAMGKKIPEEMAAQKEKFLHGCTARGMKANTAQALWEQIETFAAYGFNKAHAASYGNLSYKTAYMKANFPVDYMAAVFTADAGDVEKIAEIAAECKQMGITLLPPSINESGGTFTVIDDHTIRFGMYSIKNFGTGVSDSIVHEREANGNYTDVADFLARVADKNLNKKSLEALIKCGALDDFGERGTFMAHVDSLLSYHKESTAAPSDQGSLFGSSVSTERKPLELEVASPMPVIDRLRFEKDLLGIYVSGHPLDAHKAILDKQKLNLKAAIETFPRGVQTVIGGFLEVVKSIITKGGDRMIFGTFTDTTATLEIVVFPSALKGAETLLIPGACLMLKGAFNNRNGTVSFVVEKVKALG